MFNPDVYSERREALKRRLEGDEGVVVFLGNREVPMNYEDNPYPFRQDSSFLYYFGLDEPGFDAVIDLDNGTETLFGREGTLEDRIWMGPRPALAEQAARVGVSDVQTPSTLEDVLGEARDKGRTVHYLPPYRSEHLLRLQDLLGARPAEAKALASVELIRTVVAQRSIKSVEEIAEIEAALAVAASVHTTAMRETRPGRYEREIVGMFEGLALACGSRTSFPTIFSIHGETLHNHDHGNRMSEGDLVVHDSGAESSLHYAADITRTIPVGGRFNERQREIYEIVLAANVDAIDAIRPGIEFRAVHRLACERIAQGLIDLGLMKGNVEEAVDANAHTLFFPHGIGHMMGLDVHDMEPIGEDYVGYTDEIRRDPRFGWRSLRLAKAVEPGFVVTVEPGIYFIPELIDHWETERMCEAFIDYERLRGYRDFGGARIEDDVLVTEEGHRLLDPPIAKTIADVEAVCSEG